MKLEAVPGVEIRIDCNGASLQEHRDVNDRRETLSTGLSFIEAQSGHTFLVTFQADYPQMVKVLEDHVSAAISLDGKIITRRIYRIHHSRLSQYECQGLKSEKNGQTVMQRFTFSDLATVDESLGAIQKKDVERLGEIQVDLVWARTVQLEAARVSRKTAKRPVQSDGHKPLPEKALKGRAISSKASLGEAEIIDSGKNSRIGTVVSTETVYPHGHAPFATYIFKYRSHKDLQIEGVIERSPEPTSLEENDLENKSAEELRDLVASMRAREKEVKLEKRKHATLVKNETEDDDEIAITESRPAKRSQQSFESAKVEVVDLTDI